MLAVATATVVTPEDTRLGEHAIVLVLASGVARGTSVTITDASLVSVSAVETECESGAPTAAVEVTTTHGKSVETIEGRFQANWDTPAGADQCYRAVVDVGGYSGALTADFQTR